MTMHLSITSFREVVKLMLATIGLLGWVHVAIASEIKVKDDFDRIVALEKPAQRIISLAPHNTENLFSAGAGNRIVGVVEYSDFPPEANDILSVGSHVQFNLETILSLKPDLIVAWRGGNNGGTLDQLERLGLTVYYSEPRVFEDVLDNIRDLAILAGTESLIDPSVNTVSRVIDDARNLYGGRQPLGVFYQVWTNPLMTLNGEHFISRVLEVCGGVNLFADLPIIAPRVSMESVIKANPDAIVTGMTDSIPPDMSLWQQWKNINAVRRDAFVYVDSGMMHRHTLRMLNGIEPFCQQLDEVREAMRFKEDHALQ
ncbi:MAG: ABC transporter substrate-binding protein [Gammaproteobacteria bacterium]|nr:ABC transporter substrate-binding protein [Gammaproteobacteria bacterium]